MNDLIHIEGKEFFYETPDDKVQSCWVDILCDNGKWIAVFNLSYINDFFIHSDCGAAVVEKFCEENSLDIENIFLFRLNRPVGTPTPLPIQALEEMYLRITDHGSFFKPEILKVSGENSDSKRRKSNILAALEKVYNS